MTPRDESNRLVFDRLFERLAHAEGYLSTARIDLQRLGLPMEAGTVEGLVTKLREVSAAAVRSEEARRHDAT